MGLHRHRLEAGATYSENDGVPWGIGVKLRTQSPNQDHCPLTIHVLTIDHFVSGCEVVLFPQKQCNCQLSIPYVNTSPLTEERRDARDDHQSISIFLDNCLRIAFLEAAPMI